MSSIIIPVDKDMNSTIAIGTKEFPIQVFQDDLENFSNGFVNWHKQREIEISMVLEGSVKVNELQNERVVRQGDGFVVMPGYLHAVKPNGSKPAKYTTVIFNPVFLYGYKDSFFEKEFYRCIADSGNAVFRLPGEKTYVREIFEALSWICRNITVASPSAELQIQRRLQDVWMLLSRNVDIDKGKCRPQDVRIIQMVEYLHQNYTDVFSLDAMAGYLSISRGECCRFFKRMMNMTISEYLLEYRITKAVEMLRDTTLNITEIAQAVGFGSVSYFIAEFKKKMSSSPLKYRNNLMDKT